jgi:hypothetical protein
MRCWFPKGPASLDLSFDAISVRDGANRAVWRGGGVVHVHEPQRNRRVHERADPALAVDAALLQVADQQVPDAVTVAVRDELPPLGELRGARSGVRAEDLAETVDQEQGAMASAEVSTRSRNGVLSCASRPPGARGPRCEVCRGARAVFLTIS